MASIKITIEAIQKGFAELKADLQQIRDSVKDIKDIKVAASGTNEIERLNKAMSDLAGSMRVVSENWKKGKQAGDEYHKSILYQRSGIIGYMQDVQKMLSVQLRWYGAQKLLEAAWVPFQLLGLSIKESIKYMATLETATLGIAASYMTHGTYINKVTGDALKGEDALKAAMVDSAATMEQLKVYNLSTIATLDQLVRAYQETLPVAMAKGFDKKQVMEFTVAVVNAAGAIGLNLDMLAEETRSLLMGTISARTSRIAVALGLTNDDIRQNSQNAETLFNFLMKSLESFKIAGIESQKTWVGLLSNLKDAGLYLGEKAFRPLFEFLKEKMQEILDSILKVDKATGEIKLNPEFVQAIKNVQESIRDIVAEFYRLGMLADKAGGSLSKWAAILFGGEKADDWRWKRYEMFKDRYMESEKALQAMALADAGWKEVTAKIDEENKKAFKKGERPFEFLTVPIGEGPTSQLARFYRKKETTPEFEQKDVKDKGTKTYASQQLSATKNLYNNLIKETDDYLRLEESLLTNAHKRGEVDERTYEQKLIGLTEEANDDKLRLLEMMWEDMEPLYKQMAAEAGKSGGTPSEVAAKQKAVNDARTASYEEYILRHQEFQNKITKDTDDASTKRFLAEKKRMFDTLDLEAEIARIRRQSAVKTAEWQSQLDEEMTNYLYEKRKISSTTYYASEEGRLKKEHETKVDAYRKDFEAFNEENTKKIESGKMTEEEITKFFIEMAKRREQLTANEREAWEAYMRDRQKIMIRQKEDFSLIYEKGGIGAVFDKTFEDIMARVNDFGKIWNEKFKDIFQATSDTFNTVFMDLFDNKLKSFKDYLLMFTRAIFASLAKSAADSMASGLFGFIKIIGGLFSMGGAGGAAGSSAAAMPTLYAHQGGRIPEFHVGGMMKSDERMARVLTGERVMSREQASMFESMYENTKGGSTPSFNVTINAVDAKSFYELTKRNPSAIMDPIYNSWRSGKGIREGRDLLSNRR